jgi:hypothetical protein
VKLSTAREAYYSASGTASTITRQLALAAVAIIWLLSGGLNRSKIHLTNVLLWASLLVIAAMFFDLLQYVWTAVSFAVWARKKEKALDAAARTPRPLEPPPPAPPVPRLARMLHYPPIPPVPLSEPEGNEREIGETPSVILRVTWWLFAVKIAGTTASFVLIGVSLVHRIVLTS